MTGRLHRLWWGLRSEWRWGFTQLERGRWRWFFDVIAYRAMVFSFVARRYAVSDDRRVRTLRTRSGMTVHYRPNRGDIQGIREIFIDEIYRLPAGLNVDGLVDLGANIGLATLWLAHTYHLSGVVAVEPLPENARLLRTNARSNNIACHVIEAAVGLTSGVTFFAESEQSNLGHIATAGREVALIGLNELLSDVSFAHPLLKMDIEGMEGSLLQDLDPNWTDTFDAMVMEMHPEVVNIATLVDIITRQGFDYRDSYERTIGYQREKRERLFVKSALKITEL